MPKCKSMTFFQGSDPLQNKGKERMTWDNIGAPKVTIPARSHDFNSIEHISISRRWNYIMMHWKKRSCTKILTVFQPE